MKFTDGFWQLRHGVTALYGAENRDVVADGAQLRVTVPTTVIRGRGDTLNRPVLTLTLSSPIEGVIGVRVDHHLGYGRGLTFDLPGAETGVGSVTLGDDGSATLTSGTVRAVVAAGAPFSLRFFDGDVELTSLGHKALAHLTLAADARVDRTTVPLDAPGVTAPNTFVAAQLALGVGETIYGLGERFGPLAKNGQTVEVWNADGGTSSEQAYKNIPFYLSSRGYGVLVNHPGHVSFEIGSEAVERVQFSVPGEGLEFFVFGGRNPKGVIERYTALTGRPAKVPAWSYGLWLSTSFTTDYDEQTVTGFIDEMAERELPLSVFHFDCFWMREFNWCDFEWDPAVFPDPEGMLARLHEKDLRICVWINPYIGQRSALFAEAAEAGYLVKRNDGSIWQWDLWQAGMALVDFTNPDATAWYQDKLRGLVAQGVDAFKTDFGERIPLEVDYFDGSSPERMHNYYTELYNRAVFDVLKEEKGEGEAVLFARSATVGGQQMPVHWGGDSTSTYESMAETLRGGLSIGLSGFGFWSHDIGGFEGTPDAGVYKRWTAFGLLSSHSRFHGSNSVRVPWAFDEEAVEVTRIFTHLKLRLMPYLFQAGLNAHGTGVPVLRPMVMEFPEDRATHHLDTQYMLGDDLLVAPVFRADGVVEFYLPAGTWTNYLTGVTVVGGRWVTETHDVTSLPLYVREGAVIAHGDRVDRPDYDYRDGLSLRAYGAGSGTREVTVTTPEGITETFRVDLGTDTGRVTGSGGTVAELQIISTAASTSTEKDA